MTQEDALEILKLGHNVFLTGSAGSGKTYVINKYIEYLKERGIVVGITASTGVAATHIGGITIHSWAGIGIKKNLTDTDLGDLLKRPYLRKRFKKTKVLVIDEISMLSDYMLDMVDKVCKAFKNDERSFGGIQVVFCGDFFQLPPVAKGKERVRFVNNSLSWKEADLKVCYLEKEYRQDDQKFLHILHEIRQNMISKPSIKVLAERIYKPVHNISTRLYTHNVDVDAINTSELNKLPGSLKRYRMQVSGNEGLGNIMRKSCLAPEVLELKKGALVMFVKNNFEKGYVNGTLGVIVDFTEKNLPIVQTSSGEIVSVVGATWEIEEDGEVKARIRQLPLRLAWAITIHKSQGMSIDAAEIDLRRPFAAGMGYVALSRVRSLEGIHLKGLNHKALLVNEEILGLDKILKEESRKTVEELKQLNYFELQVLQMMFLRELNGGRDPNENFLYRN